MNDLKAFNQFHDWYLDTIHVSKESETLTLGLYLQERRALVSFVVFAVSGGSQVEHRYEALADMIAPKPATDSGFDGNIAVPPFDNDKLNNDVQ